jgi:hypothetical protein
MTKASNERPTRRLMETKQGPLVVEIRRDFISIRPKGARTGGPAEVLVTASSIYERALMGRAEPLVSKARMRR